MLCNSHLVICELRAGGPERKRRSSGRRGGTGTGTSGWNVSSARQTQEKLIERYYYDYDQSTCSGALSPPALAVTLTVLRIPGFAFSVTVLSCVRSAGVR